MADLLYANYLHQFERSERIVLPRNNPFDDYDEKNSKRDSDCPSLVAVSKLLEQVNDGNNNNNNNQYIYKQRQSHAMSQRRWLSTAVIFRPSDVSLGFAEM